MKTLTLALCLCALSSCQSTRTEVIDLPVEIDRGVGFDGAVPVFDERNPPIGISITPFAELRTSGIDATSAAAVRHGMSRKAAALGADCVWVATEGETVTGATSVYLGFGLFDSFNRSAKYAVGFACRWTPSFFGAVVNESHEVTDVIPDSPAARAGIRVGERILAVDGRRMSESKWAWHSARARMRARQPSMVEIVLPGGDARTIEVVPDSVNPPTVPEERIPKRPVRDSSPTAGS